MPSFGFLCKGMLLSCVGTSQKSGVEEALFPLASSWLGRSVLFPILGDCSISGITRYQKTTGMAPAALQVDHMAHHMEASERSMQERIQRLEAIRRELEEVRASGLGACVPGSHWVW